jgi:crotonobetainyl-CoA:carnitine CoA-transferase CaiB-like acyl-CoA transferase
MLNGVRADLGLAKDPGLEIVGEARPAVLSSPLAVADCAVAAVAACLTAAADLAAARSGHRPAITLDTAHVAAAVRSEAWVRDPAGRGIDGFAALSTLWPAADGWVRTHANYPWHRAALLTALGVDDGPDADVRGSVADAIAARSALEIEQLVYDRGGLAVAARMNAEWRAQSQNGASPLVGMVPNGTAAPLREPGQLPASGVRVLDLTRVIAGPVGTRMLGALGADVLRVDDPHRPELPSHAIDGVIGKASSTVDGKTEYGREVLHRLVDQADVLVTGYRPGALRRLGLEPDQVAERHPGTIVVTLSAWGTQGPWGSRRGFDSLVQIATGIGWATSEDNIRPGALPCQLLDHATGYLTAAGALTGLARRTSTGETTHVSLSLARTAQWLLDQGSTPNEPVTGEDPDREADHYRCDLGNGWSGIGPPGLLDGRLLSWPHLPPAYGQAPPAWK